MVFFGGPMLKYSSACNISDVAMQMQFGILGTGISEVNCCWTVSNSWSSSWWTDTNCRAYSLFLLKSLVPFGLSWCLQDWRIFFFSFPFFYKSPCPLKPKGNVGIASKSGFVHGGEKCAHMMGWLTDLDNKKANAFSLQSLTFIFKLKRA